MKMRVYTSSTDVAAACSPSTPLWQVAPTRDSEGQLLTDFMMLIPRLRDKPRIEIERTSVCIRSILSRHREVVFARSQSETESAVDFLASASGRDRGDQCGDPYLGA
jgi:hypothetical protein